MQQQQTKKCKKHQRVGVIEVLKEYGQRSSLHGISHLNQSPQKTRKYAWLIIFALALVLSCYHIYHTLQNYKDSPFTSAIFKQTEEMYFPDVTFCNMMPVGSSIYHFYMHKFEKYLGEHWNYFEAFENEEEFGNVSTTEYQYYMMQKYFKYLSMFWVSDDSRDLGMTDLIFPFLCFHGNSYCNTSFFKLVQHPTSWNCYTFIPQNRKIITTKDFGGLWIILFSDSASIMSDKNVNKNIEFRSDKLQKMFFDRNATFKQFLQAGGSLNQILNGDRVLDMSFGWKVYIHPHDRYPFLSGLTFDLPNGVRSVINLVQTNYKLEDYDKSPCSDSNPPLINYTVSFGDNSSNIRYRSYGKTHEEAFTEELQNLMFEKCGCYSHLWPFTCEPKTLCYFVPRNEWLEPSNRTQEKMFCHDDTIYHIEEKSFDLLQQSRKYRPCKSTRYSAQKFEIDWPGTETVKELVNNYLTDTSWDSDDNIEHRILGKLGEVNGLPTKGKAMQQSLIHQNCAERNSNSTKSLTLEKFWCADLDTFKNNFALVLIKPEVQAANVYKEEDAYKWPEVLSEIGGTMGLWLGMSLATIVELLELLFLCCCQKKVVTETQKNEDGTERLEECCLKENETV